MRHVTRKTVHERLPQALALEEKLFAVRAKVRDFCAELHCEFQWIRSLSNKVVIVLETMPPLFVVVLFDENGINIGVKGSESLRERFLTAIKDTE